MKSLKHNIFCFLAFGTTLTISISCLAKNSATNMVAAAEKHVKGTSFHGKLKMIVQRNDSERTLELESWLKSDDYSLVRVLNPAKDRGSGTLRIKFELWQFLPKIDRIVKVPASMMLQAWMGSDFSNDDLVKSTSLARDYTHKELGKEKVGDIASFKIECLPKKNATIVWGKVILWVREKDFSPVKQEYYTERGKLVKTFNGSNHKTFGKRTIPTKVVMTPANSQNQKTTLHYTTAQFDGPIDDSVFTQNQLRSEID
jgi:outer membrane lipoprotein-sorting protein